METFYGKLYCIRRYNYTSLIKKYVPTDMYYIPTGYS